jgi:hypothetical protein
MRASYQSGILNRTAVQQLIKIIMPEQENILLTDRDIYPTDELIFSIIGDKKIMWQSIMSHMSGNYKDSSGEWNFYNDGKRWLFKMVHKKKTVFWAAILTDAFRITFYLGNKAEPIIENSDLPQSIKEEFRTAKRYGLIRPVTFIINDKTDVDNVLKMIAIKSKIK